MIHKKLTYEKVVLDVFLVNKVEDLRIVILLLFDMLGMFSFVNNFLNSEYYKNMNFVDNFVKENLPKVGIDNQGTLLIFLYTMLVVPKQLIEQDVPNEFAQLNTKVDQIKSDANSTYRQDSEKIDYIKTYSKCRCPCKINIHSE